MAVDVSGLRSKIARYGEQVQRAAADRVESNLRQRAPVAEENGGSLRAAITRTDTSLPGRHTSRLTVPPGGGDRPRDLPDWLDRGVQFPIRARRARALRFTSRGRVIFRREVLWNRSRRSQGFWSGTVNQDEWDRALQDAARDIG